MNPDPPNILQPPHNNNLVPREISLNPMATLNKTPLRTSESLSTLQHEYPTQYVTKIPLTAHGYDLLPPTQYPPIV